MISEHFYSSERVFTIVDQPYYISGDRIRYSAFIIDGNTLKPGVKSKVAYTELMNPEGRLYISHNLEIGDGHAFGEIELKSETGSGIFEIF